MKLEPFKLYHVYNQGNNKEVLFRQRADYLAFLKYVRKFISEKVDILAYALMPNHFHFLLNTTMESVATKKIGSLESTELQNGVRLLLTSYAKIYNEKYDRSGFLFRQNTKYKMIESEEDAFICFNYIHQNPMSAQLCQKMEDWEFSSFRDYINQRKGTLVNKQMARELIGIDDEIVYKESYKIIPEWKWNRLY